MEPYHPGSRDSRIGVTDASALLRSSAVSLALSKAIIILNFKKLRWLRFRLDNRKKLMNERQVNQVSSSPATETVGHQLEPVVSALQHHFGPNLVAVVLFGSRARGDHQPESDWDLLVVARQLPQRTFQRHLHLKRLLPPLWRGQVSILAKTPAEFEAGVPALFLDIALDGIILYDVDNYMSGRLTRLRELIREAGLYREQRGRDLIWQWREFPGLGCQLTWEGII